MERGTSVLRLEKAVKLAREYGEAALKAVVALGATNLIREIDEEDFDDELIPETCVLLAEGNITAVLNILRQVSRGFAKLERELDTTGKAECRRCSGTGKVCGACGGLSDDCECECKPEKPCPECQLKQSGSVRCAHCNDTGILCGSCGWRAANCVCGEFEELVCRYCSKKQVGKPVKKAVKKAAKVDKK